MFRALTVRAAACALRQSSQTQVSRHALAAGEGVVTKNAPLLTQTVVWTRHMSHGPQESENEFDARYVACFNRPDIDGWEVRQLMSDLSGMDLVPEPKITIAALNACRRINDLALAIRWLETVRDRCGNNKQAYAYVMQEIKPALEALGIPTVEEMGYDKPELWLKNVYE